MPRAHNKHIDALATLASKINVLGEAVDVQIVKRSSHATSGIYLLTVCDVQHWRSFIVQNVNQPFTTNVVKNLTILW